MTFTRSQWLHGLSWFLAALAFGFGTWIGMTSHARVGAGLWIVSAVLALLPFASHRHRV